MPTNCYGSMLVSVARMNCPTLVLLRSTVMRAYSAYCIQFTVAIEL